MGGVLEPLVRTGDVQRMPDGYLESVYRRALDLDEHLVHRVGEPCNRSSLVVEREGRKTDPDALPPPREHARADGFVRGQEAQDVVKQVVGEAAHQVHRCFSPARNEL
jgi:hypothetical protein